MSSLALAQTTGASGRRGRIAASADVTGIDGVTVDRVAVDRWRLRLTFIPGISAGKQVIPVGLSVGTIRLRPEGGGLDTVLRTLDVQEASGGSVDVIVGTQGLGADTLVAHESFILSLEGLATGPPGTPPYVDPLFRSARFVLSPATTLGGADPGTHEAPSPWTGSSYLAKDYDTFRRLLLDRLSVSVPEWTERNPSDLGVMLVELLAYVGDYLSWQQDALMTESALVTSRLRTSVRRHARLLDYTFDEGCNLRCWVHARMPDGASPVTLDKGALLWAQTQETDGGRGGAPPPADPFETVTRQSLDPRLNRLTIHTWSQETWTLDAGACSVVVVDPGGDDLPLAAGDVLFLQGVDPDGTPTGSVGLRLAQDPVPRRDELEDLDLLEITWVVADRLSRAWPVASVSDAGPATGLAVLLGNNLLVDSGQTMRSAESIGPPSGHPPCIEHRFPGLVYAQPFAPGASEGAAALLEQDPKQALPAIVLFQDSAVPPLERRTDPAETLFSAPAQASGPASFTLDQISTGARRWFPRNDLLDSSRYGRHFVLESPPGRGTTLRFGDGVFGRRPPAGARFGVLWRAERKAGRRQLGAQLRFRADPSLGPTVVAALGDLTSPTASGEPALPESMREGRSYPPGYARTQARCVTETDWRERARAFPGVRDAAVAFEWTGSRYVVVVAVQLLSSVEWSPELGEQLRRSLTPYAMQGQRVVVRPPKAVPMGVVLRVTVEPGQRFPSVARALDATLQPGIAPSGEPGFFDPSNFGFGEALYLSRLVAAALQCPGVASVWPERFGPVGETSSRFLVHEVVTVGPDAVIRLANVEGSPQEGYLRYVRGES